MNLSPAHIHLALNHIPVLGTMFGVVLLIWALAAKSESVKKLSFSLLFAMALFALPVYLSGEPAEEVVEKQPDISHDLIEAHEEAALASLLAVELAGLLSLGGLALSRRGRVAPRGLTAAAVGVSLVASVLIARTALLGGQIHHPEIRTGAQGSSAAEEGDDAGASGERDDQP